MGHCIHAYADRALVRPLATLRISPREGFAPGNFYEVAEATEFRRSCSGTGEVAQFEFSGEEAGAGGNAQSQKFLDEIWRSEAIREGSRVWIRFA